MAILEKSRARKPLAENRMSLSWSNYRAGGEGERHNLHVSADEDDGGHRYSLKLTPLEALSFVTHYARHATFDQNAGTVDRRPAYEALRALADQLEAENRDD